MKKKRRADNRRRPSAEDERRTRAAISLIKRGGCELQAALREIREAEPTLTDDQAREMRAVVEGIRGKMRATDRFPFPLSKAMKLPVVDLKLVREIRASLESDR